MPISTIIINAATESEKKGHLTCRIYFTKNGKFDGNLYVNDVAHPLEFMNNEKLDILNIALTRKVFSSIIYEDLYRFQRFNTVQFKQDHTNELVLKLSSIINLLHPTK